MASACQTWLANVTGLDKDNIFLCKIAYNKITTMARLDFKSSNEFSDYYNIFAYEVVPEAALPGAITAVSEAEGKEEAEKADPVKDENGFYPGMKCRVRWNSMRFRFYNATVTSRNEDGTYEILFEDQDTNSNVPFEEEDEHGKLGRRMEPKPWIDLTNSHTNWNKPSLMAQGFHSNKPDGRITVELVHRIAKPPPVYPTFPVKCLTQWPLVLCMRKNITGAQLHDLVWDQVERFVSPDTEWGRHNLPYQLMRGESYSAERTMFEIADAEGVAVDFKEREVVVVAWSPEGHQSGFDVTAFERREDHESYPSRTNSKTSGGLSVIKCFDAFGTEEQLGENDKWHGQPRAISQGVQKDDCVPHRGGACAAPEAIRV